MIAQVVIDIQHEKVNQIYDYIVPQPFEDFLSRGMRVIVSFGAMKRMGIVVDLIDESQSASKPILEVLDSIPTIDEELFLMIDEMKKESYELLSSLYLTVIPDVLLASYQKVARIMDNSLVPEDLQHFFSKRGIWRLKVSDQVHYPRLKRLKDQGVLSIETVIREKKTEKKQAFYEYQEHHHYAKISQYSMLEGHPFNEPQTKQQLHDIGLTDSMIQTLVKHGVLTKKDVDVDRHIQHSYTTEKKEITLSDEQKRAVERITSSTTDDIFLLKGITGSGKTEVYLHTLEKIIQEGKRALILVPEINQIPQMAMRLESHFKEIAIYHSGLSKGERYDQWKHIIKGDRAIILGTRSAIFLPIDHLGIIIVDEEHDESYRSFEGVYYDAKELAIWKAKHHHIPLVLGSATPSVESMYHAKKEHYHLLELTKRPFDLPLPTLTCVDMKEELKAKHLSIFSRQLLTKMQDRLAKNEQTILLLNRKGYAPFVMCRACGDVPRCPHCEVSLAFYKDKKILKCPYCGHEIAFDATCQVCHEPKVKEVGIGIEYVEEQLKKVLPSARILRMDQSATKTKGAHEVIWHAFKEEQADILIGTQMVSKGLDFPKVTLVGILMSDMMLNIPSYVASEKAYTLFTQMTGRSGRMLQGEAIIQGYHLDHYVIKSLNQDDHAFYEEALKQRKLLGYPPYVSVAHILFEGMSFLQTYQHAFLFKKVLASRGYEVLGPSQALIKKMKDHYRFTLTIKHDTDDFKPVFDLITKHQKSDIKITCSTRLDQW